MYSTYVCMYNIACIGIFSSQCHNVIQIRLRQLHRKIYLPNKLHIKILYLFNVDPKPMNNFGQENNLQGYLDLAMWAANIAQEN